MWSARHACHREEHDQHDNKNRCAKPEELAPVDQQALLELADIPYSVGHRRPSPRRDQLPASECRDPDDSLMAIKAAELGERLAIDQAERRRQSRVISSVEEGVWVLMAVVTFPVLGLQASLGQNLRLALVFTVVSIGRSFLPRRLFDGLRG